MSEHVYNAFFVDLFVRVSNALAINMYNTFGYSVYRRVVGYYSGEEDAFGECFILLFRFTVCALCLFHAVTWYRC